MILVCDICKREVLDDLELSEFHRLEKHCGYSSVFGDGSLIKIDICQHCFKDKLGDFVIIENKEM